MPGEGVATYVSQNCLHVSEYEKTDLSLKSALHFLIHKSYPLKHTQILERSPILDYWPSSTLLNVGDLTRTSVSTWYHHTSSRRWIIPWCMTLICIACDKDASHSYRFGLVKVLTIFNQAHVKRGANWDEYLKANEFSIISFSFHVNSKGRTSRIK